MEAFMMIPQLFGITGKKEHGKDTLAKMIVEKRGDFKIIHFADDLKNIAQSLYGLTYAQCYDTVGKETPFDKPCVMDEYVDRLSEVTGLKILPRNLVAESPRQLLQYLGTDYVRSVKDSFWVDSTLARAKKIGACVLIPDARFPNEADAIRAASGKILKIIRTEKESDKNSAHASERGIDEIKADWTLPFLEGELDRIKYVAEIVASGLLYRLDDHDPYQIVNRYLDKLNSGCESIAARFGYGVNIVPRYSTDGKKKYHAVDFAPIPKQKPTDASIAHAGTVLSKALEDTLNGKNPESQPRAARGDEEAASCPSGGCGRSQDH
jgi:hypothetical protein